MQRYTICEIDLAAIRHNVGVMKAHVAGGTGSLEKLESALEQATGSAWDGYLSDMLAF